MLPDYMLERVRLIARIIVLRKLLRKMYNAFRGKDFNRHSILFEIILEDGFNLHECANEMMEKSYQMQLWNDYDQWSIFQLNFFRTFFSAKSKDRPTDGGALLKILDEQFKMRDVLNAEQLFKVNVNTRKDYYVV